MCQNTIKRVIKKYYKKINEGKLPIKRQPIRKVSCSTIALLSVGFLFLLFGIFLDCSDETRQFVYKLVKDILDFIHEDLFYEARFIKQKIVCMLESLREHIESVNAILASAVVFYYSVIDNHKEGIPHRTIVSYTYGSYTIPILFFLAMLLVPIAYFLYQFSAYITTYMCIAYTYMLQLWIILLILLSTSIQFSIRAIYNMEIRQFLYYSDINHSSTLPFDNVDKRWEQRTLHLERAIVSEELFLDKIELIKALLYVPYCSKEKHIGKPIMDFKKLKSNDTKGVYKYYFTNLLQAFRSINEEVRVERRNNIYDLLYSFMKEMKLLYYQALDYQKDTKYKGDKEQAEDEYLIEINYFMTICAIINAIMTSSSKEEQSFCNYVFNKCIFDESDQRQEAGVIREIQLGLYFLYHEFLDYTVESYNPKLDRIFDIKNMENWTFDLKYLNLYSDCWNIWTEETSVTDVESINIKLRNVISTLSGNDYASPISSYIMLQINRKKGLQSAYEDENDSAN